MTLCDYDFFFFLGGMIRMGEKIIRLTSCSFFFLFSYRVMNIKRHVMSSFDRPTYSTFQSHLSVGQKIISESCRSAFDTPMKITNPFCNIFFSSFFFFFMISATRARDDKCAKLLSHHPCHGGRGVERKKRASEYVA